MSTLPPLPPGFTLDQQPQDLPPLPPGFTLDQPGAPPVDSYAPPATVPVRDPMNPDAPPTMKPTMFTEPGKPRTGMEVLQIIGQAGLRGAADLAGTVYDLPNLAFMGGQQVGKAADEFSAFLGRAMGGDRRVSQDYQTTGMGEALGNAMGSTPQTGSINLGDAIAETASETVDPFVQKTILGREQYAPPMTEEDMGNLDILYNPIRFAAGSAGGGMALASQAAKKLPDVGRHGIVDKILDAYRFDPKTTIARDAAAGAGAGVGVDNAPDMPFGDIIGPLAGAFAGSSMFGLGLSGVNAADNVSQNLTRGSLRVNGEVFSPAQVKEAMRRLQAGTVDPLTGEADNLGVAQTIEDQANYFRERSLHVPDAGVLAEGSTPFQELGKYRRGKNPGIFEANDAKVKQSASENVGTLLDPTADQGAVARRAEGARLERLAPLTQEVEARQTALGTAQQGAADEALPYQNLRDRADLNQMNASRDLDEVVTSDYYPDRTAKNEAFRVDPNHEEFVSIEPMRQTLQRIRNQANEFGPENLQLPLNFIERIQAVLNRAGPDEDMMASVGELSELRPFIARARADALKAGNLDTRDNLNALQQSIDAIIGDHPGVAAANRHYSDTFAPKWRPGPGDEMARFTKDLDREPFGDDGVPTRTQTPPENTANRFLSGPTKAAALGRVLRNAPDRETGLAAVNRYMLNDFSKAVLDPQGNLSPQKAARWLTENEPTLAEFPEMLRSFEQRVARARTATGAAEQADELRTAAQRALDEETQAVDRSAIRTLLDEDPYDVAKDLLTSPRRGSTRTWEEIERIVANDEAASRGWRAALSESLWGMVTDTVKSADGELIVNTTKLAKLMKAKEGDLRRAFGDDFDTIEGSLRLVETLRNIPRGAIPGSQSAWNIKNLLTNPAAEAALKLRYGVLKGGGILRSLRIAAEALPTGEANIERLMELAFFKTDLMTDLLRGKLREIPRGNSNSYARGLQQGYVASAGGDNAPEEE